MRQLSFLFLILIVSLFMATPVTAAEKNDRLDIASGAVLISATTEYNQKWAGMMLLDGTTEMGWCSTRKLPYPNTFIIELPNSVAIKSFYIDNTNAQESGYPGISARRFKLYVSNQSANDGFELVYEGEASMGERKGFTMERMVPGQWLKLEVLSNWGNPDYTEIMELEAYGEPVNAVTASKPVGGVYETNYGIMWLRQKGVEVEGCYDWDDGRLAGTTDGRVIRFQWVESGPQTGTAIMVLTSDRSFLNGLWYENSRYQGLWHGKRVTDGRQPKCLQAFVSGMKEDAIGRSLDEVGRAIIYGIYFDYDTATIKPDSEETLNRVLKAIKARPEVKLIVEGHTDSRGSDTYNRALSEKRAQAVVNWLVAHGIAEKQLSAKGFGESVPVADNAKPDGRALNRRVEIALEE